MWTFDGSSLVDRVNEMCHFVLPVGIGTTADCNGSIHFLGGTGEFAGVSGEGSIAEILTFTDGSFDASGVGLETWSLHLP